MATPTTRAKFLYSDMNPATVVPVTVELLQDVDEPPRVLRDPHPDYAGDWVYDGIDGDTYVYREQTDDTERGALDVAQHAAAVYGTPMPTIPDDAREALTGTADGDGVSTSADDVRTREGVREPGYLPPDANDPRASDDLRGERDLPPSATGTVPATPSGDIAAVRADAPRDDRV